MATNGSNDGGGSHSLTNYCSYIDPETQRERIGSLDEASNSIQPLAYKSGTPLSTLYEVIQVGENGIAAAGERISRSDTRLLPPINGRDVLCVGKNYAEHAKEFNKSGYDSSDKVDQPTHPVIFTKRFTSIIADGEEIYPHPKFTKTVDYEGELGVIVGRPGFRISEENAMDYVWGYTIVNDMTARERQRDHKQFYVGKSPDSFCPMGPIAVPAHKVNNVLRVQTHVNGALRQDATTDDLIFSIPFLVKTLSEGQTIMPGDVLATGTPAGVGFGQDPPSYLNPGDEVSVSITGLGRLTNKISSINSQNTTLLRVQHLAAQATDTARYRPSSNLTDINGKTLNLRQLGNKTGAPAVFIHGLGGTLDFWTPLITATKLKDEYQCHVFDFEGHGLSPTNALSKLSIESLSQDVQGIFTSLNIQPGGILFAHSLGCLVALKFVLTNPGLVRKLVLLGPPPSPLPNAGSKGSHARAALVRTKGMAGVVDAVVMAGTSDKSKSANPLAIAATRLSLLGQNPEGYAKACTALAEATDELPVEDIKADIWIITGSEDQVSPPQLCRAYERRLANVKGVEVLDNVGHWHVYEDLPGVAKALQAVL